MDVRGPVFTLQATDGLARAGVIHTGHGDVPTPVFMPVATQGSVKAVGPDDLKVAGARMVLGNAYHLYLRPGVETIEAMGGLHRFMGWDGPILTDSGGFQGFSLEHLRRVNEEGIVFKSHIDGSLHTFTPEASIRYQERLGADIIMPLDVCVSSLSEGQAVETAVERTARWAVRSFETHKRKDQVLFGIVQGGLSREMRERSASFTVKQRAQGYAIGGLSIGESKPEMYDVVGLTAGLLPPDRPRYLMGVGSPEDLVECVARGVDMFDCALPTRIARNGALLVREGRVHIDTAPFRTRDGPVDEGCDCYTCQTFPAAYLHHLFRARELLVYRLATVHNLRFVFRLMEEIREAIKMGEFNSYRRAFVERFIPTDEETRRAQKLKWLDAKGSLRSSMSDTERRQ